MLAPTLGVRTVVDELTTPIGLAFLGGSDMLVLEKDTGKVQRVINGDVTAIALDLGVNNASERGLLGIALHPDFPANPGVYLFWTCRSTGPTPSPPDPEFVPAEAECLDSNMFAADSSNLLEVPVRANRVDRFEWDSATSTLTFDHNLIMLRAFQNDAAAQPPGQSDSTQPARGNHNGGVLRFGPAGCALQRSGIFLEIRGRARCDWIRFGTRTRPAVRG